MLYHLRRLWALTHDCREAKERRPKNFLTHAQADLAITAKAAKRIGRYLDAHGKVNNSLARDERCIEFIAGSLIKIVVGDLRQELWGPDPKHRPSILSGRELLLPRRPICIRKLKSAKVAARQIREDEG